MRIKFYKFRAILSIYLIRLMAFILRVEVPPIVSVAAIIRKEKKMLFLNLSYMKGYGIPGGLVKSGETLEETLKREVLEETGLIVEDSKYLSSRSSKAWGVPTINVAFLVKASGDLKSSEEGKLYWIDPKEAAGKMAYKDNAALINDIVGQ